MNITNRITRLINSPTKDFLIAADVKGQIHKFDLNLNLIQSSQSTGYSSPINAMVAYKDAIYTRNRRGSVCKWDLKTLKPITVHDDYTLREDKNLLENEEPSPTSARGIGVINGKVYTNNGYGQLLILDSETLDVLDIKEKISEQFFDSFSTENSEYQAMGETSGYLHIGNLERMEFPIKEMIDGNNIHWIRWDDRHKRFWATQDAGGGEDKFLSNGVITISTDGKEKQEYHFTYDDVEALELDDEYKYVYVGAFDGHIYVFDNEHKELTLSNVIGPFPYSVLNLVYISKDKLFVLMQNGEIHCINSLGEFQYKANYKGSCVWELAAHPLNKNLIYCAKDDGVDILSYELGKFNSINVRVAERHKHFFGLIKRIKPLRDGSYLAIGHKGVVFKANQDGNLEWFLHLSGVPRSIDIDSDEERALVAIERGSLHEINLKTGSILNTIDTNGKPVWVTGYTYDDLKLCGTKDGELNFYDENNKVVKTINIDGVPKRYFLHEGKTYIVGSCGLVELDMNSEEVKKQWVDLLINTKESSVILGDFVHVVSYGFQVGTYKYDTGEWFDLEENVQDFPKATFGIQGENGENYLLVGGRGNYINAYKVINGLPQKVREFYLH
ncbi:hypothetical protein ACE41A_21730 [Bacillus cytotoxicus]|uniref:hypothetical protein n=1 Tax=Bacillus cytotoxicus TaxID=580165 RepID=UPI0035CC3A5F